MSADEYDPEIERLFARSPQMPDATLFAADIEAKLASGSRVRTLALTLAGLVGGVIAVRETVNINFMTGGETVTGRAVDQGVQSAGAGLASATQGVLDQLGVADVSLGSMGGMQLFWITAGALIALAAAGVMKLSQDI